MVRNYITFRQVIPIKSNLFYELYQSNYMDEDGILDMDTFKLHPYNDNVKREEYVSLGEQAFIEKYRVAFFRATALNPWTFIKKVGNRFIHAFILYPKDNGVNVKFLIKACIYWIELHHFEFP